MFKGINEKIVGNVLIRYAILAYWVIFWLFNSLDKVIGGSHFLWVGRDRFAQFHKFFASAGMDSPAIANIALIVAAALEIFAFVFFTGALIHFVKKNQTAARTWFFVGIVLTLVTFTVFAIGDHIFGDRFELLEHTLFWFITLMSWGIYIRIDKVQAMERAAFKRGQMLAATLVLAVLVIITSGTIFKHNEDAFYQRTEAIEAQQIGVDLYKVSFPFLGGSTVFEKSIKLFKQTYPEKRIDHIYTVPNPLRLKKADALIFYIITEDKK